MKSEDAEIVLAFKSGHFVLLRKGQKRRDHFENSRSKFRPSVIGFIRLHGCNLHIQRQRILYVTGNTISCLFLGQNAMH